MPVQAWTDYGEGGWAALCNYKPPRKIYGATVYVIVFPDEPEDEEGNPFNPAEWATKEAALKDIERAGYRTDIFEFRTV